MKRIALIALITAIAVISTGAAFAQAGGGKGPGMDQQKGQPVKVEGTLVIADSQIAIQTKDGTYTVRGFEYLIGFVDGLKEGAAVRVEGELISMGGKSQILRATKLNFKGRDFDLSKNSQGPMMGQGGSQGGPGMGGQGGPGQDR